MNTSKLLSIVALVAATILFMGCPYSSSIPLSEANLKASDNMIGTWEKSDETTVHVEIKRATGNNLVITKTTAGEEGADPTVETYDAFLTDINGTLFLNLKEQTDYSDYYFYKISKEGEFKITISSVTPNIREKFEESAAMKKFFAENMKNSYFFESTDETYFKVK